MATPQDGRPLLVAEGVRKVYRTGEIEVEALAGLDLTVLPGENPSRGPSVVRTARGRSGAG